MSKKKEVDPILYGRCDSFVVETNVHYPTDINLLYDAIRKVISLSKRLCEKRGYTDFRQHVYLQKRFKHFFRLAQKVRLIDYQCTRRKIKQKEKNQKVYGDYIERARR